MMDLKRWGSAVVSILLLSLSLNAQTNITWQVLSNTQVSGTTLSKPDPGTVGYAHSANILYGFNGTNDFEGKVTYTLPNDTEEKTIGFAIYSNSNPTVGSMDYGIRITPAITGSRPAPGYIYVFYPGSGAISASYAANDQISIERVGNRMIFKKGTTTLSDIVVNHLNALVVTAELTSSAASFTGVQVDFTNTLPGFVPILDQSARDIRFTGTSGLTFNWLDGDEGTSNVKGMKGVYPIVITDNNDNRLDRVYSLGEATPWSNLYNTKVTGTTLGMNGTFASGAAGSSTTYATGDHAWVEYVVKYQSDPKAFGLLNSATTITSYTHLGAGFYINKTGEPAAQVIVNGSIVKKLVCRENDVLKIMKHSGKFFWYINGVQVHYVTPSSYSYKVGAWIGKNATLVDVHQGKDVAESSYLTPSYSETTDNGSIAVNLSSISGLSSPYNHFLSDTKVIPMTTAFTEINADFGGTLNQANFLAGKDASNTITYSNLDMGCYVVSSFDNNGHRIFGSKQTVLGDLSQQNASGVSVSNGHITSSSVSAYATLNLQMHDREIPESYIEISLEGLTAKQGYGFGNDGVTIDGYDDMEFGFYLENEKLYLIDEGVIPSTYFIVEKDMKLKMVINGETASYFINDRPVGAASFTRLEFLTFGVIGHLNGKIRTLGGVSKNPVKNIRYAVSANDCDQFLATLQLTLPTSFGIRPMTYSLQLKDASGANVGSVNQTTFTNLPIGIYTLTGTATAGAVGLFPAVSYAVNFPVYVGVKYTAQSSEHVIAGTNGNNVLGDVSISLPSTDGESVGVNVLPNATNGWISFRPVTMPTGTNYFNTIQLTENPQLNVATATADDISIRFSSTSNYFYYNNPTSQTSIQMNYWLTQQPITIRRQGTTAYIDNGQSSLTLASGYTTARCRPSFVVKRWNVGFKEVVTSMNCPVQKDQYAELKYDLDGYYHIMEDGKINFIFDQEYGTSTLKFNIYRKRDELYKVHGHFPTVNVTNGKNYVSLDITGTQTCLGKGYFYLEVINDKNEKQYLRFYNTYTGCLPAESPEH